MGLRTVHLAGGLIPVEVELVNDLVLPAGEFGQTVAVLKRLADFRGEFFAFLPRFDEEAFAIVEPLIESLHYVFKCARRAQRRVRELYGIQAFAA